MTHGIISEFTCIEPAAASGHEEVAAEAPGSGKNGPDGMLPVFSSFGEHEKEAFRYIRRLD